MLGFRIAGERRQVYNLFQEPVEQIHIDFEQSGFWMVVIIAVAKAGPFENQTIWIKTFKKSRFQMVRFQIPTVFGSSLSFNQIYFYLKMVQNVMLCHALGGAVILCSLQHFIAPALDLMACLPSQQRRHFLG